MTPINYTVQRFHDGKNTEIKEGETSEGETMISIIRKTDLVKAVPDGWMRQYPPGQLYGARKDVIRKRLFELRDKGELTEGNINSVIGSDSWTQNECDECGKDADILVRIGEVPDYDHRWIDICSDCLNSAVAALGIISEDS